MKTKQIPYRTPRLRLLGALFSIGAPIVYMVGSHIGWMSSPEEKRSMAIKQAGFWGGMALTALAVRQVGFWGKSSMKAYLSFLAAATYPILGYKAAKWLMKTFPNMAKVNKTSMSQTPEKVALHDPDFIPPIPPPPLATTLPIPAQQPSTPTYWPYYAPQNYYNPQSSYYSSYPTSLQPLTPFYSR